MGEISGRPEYQKGLEKFLSLGKKLQILMQKDKHAMDQKPPGIFNLLKLYSIVNPESIKIKTHPYTVQRQGADSGEIHFMVADERMFRIEEDISKFTAVGNFNDPTNAGKLSRVFDEIITSKNAISVTL